MQAIYTKIVSYKSEILIFFKWLSIPIVFIALYYQLFIKTNYLETWEVFQTSFTLTGIGYLLLALALLPLNLSTETAKWYKLLKKLHQITFKKSFESLLAGISLSIFTPKRIGEYGGRILVLRKNKAKALASLFVSNLSQSIANLIIGLFTILSYGWFFSLSFKNKELIIATAILFSIALLTLYFNLNLLVQFLSRFKFFQKRNIPTEILNHYNNSELIEFLFYSAAKYFIFILQFVLIIKAFGIDIQLFAGIICASSVFFIKTMLPVPASVELAARGSIAIFFFQIFTENHIGILVASIILWIMNLGLPAVIGSFIIANQKIE